MSEEVLGIPLEIPVRKSRLLQIGTLQYTTWGLINLFVWLLWGDFCYQMLELVIPRLLPLLFRDMNASNSLISFMIGSVPAILSITILPPFCTRSDAHRGRLGRRIPFLLLVTPFAAFFLILIGYSGSISSWLQNGVFSRFMNSSPATIALIVVCTLVIMFHLFNLFMSTMYNCLFADVVPHEVLGRFLSLFRAVAMVAGFIFSRYILPMADSHRKEIFLGVGLIYFISFMVMCWRVKEGQYPPVEERKDHADIWKSIKTYFQECFTIRIYLYLLLALMMFNLTVCMSPFYILFYRETLKMSMDDMGKYLGWISLAQAVDYLIVGYMCDRLNAVRMILIGFVILAITTPMCFFFIHDWTTLMVFSLMFSFGAAFYGISSMAVCIVIFPRDKYGQYISAMNLLSAIVMVIGNYFGGKFIDVLGTYRAVYLWASVFFLLAIVPMICVYREWMRHGGPANYVPPTLELRKGS